MLKAVAFYLTSSIRDAIKRSCDIRRYVNLKSDVVTPENSENSETIELMIQEIEGWDNTPPCIETIPTDNGTMIGYVDMKMLRKKLDFSIQKWMSLHSPPERNTHRQSGFYKKLLRLKILLDHVNTIYNDKYNVYQAAYINDGYSSRAFFCFILQVVSTLALVIEPNDYFSSYSKSLIDYVLMLVTVMYMLFNIPANYSTSNMSHSVVLMNIFNDMGMIRRVIFVTMNFVVNTILISFIPLISARLLSGTTRSTEIVTRSLSVMFITSLDDNAITKGESNNLKDSQDLFLKEMVERVDQCRDSDNIRFVVYMPWVESLLLLSSVIYAYIILLT